MAELITELKPETKSTQLRTVKLFIRVAEPDGVDLTGFTLSSSMAITE
jgi:hypothetical protein